jgi:small subunit ribosomal protein S20
MRTLDFFGKVIYNRPSLGLIAERSIRRKSKLANTKSAMKRIRQTTRKQRRNLRFRSAARTHIRKTRRLIAEGRLEEAQEAARQAISTLDKAAVKGILHPNNVARRKSRLMRHLSQALGQPQGE